MQLDIYRWKQGQRNNSTIIFAAKILIEDLYYLQGLSNLAHNLHEKLFRKFSFFENDIPNKDTNDSIKWYMCREVLTTYNTYPKMVPFIIRNVVVFFNFFFQK